MDATRAFVKKILIRAENFDWSLQGFGMLRLHMDDGFRLNVWDSRYRVKNVSMVHTHPWNFESLVVCGRLVNWRYHESGTGYGKPYRFATIKPGPGGGLLDTRGEEVWLTNHGEVITAGVAYRQSADEIHLSAPEDGTVTLNKRQRVGEDVARVYWPANTEWVSAEPRPATITEISTITNVALARLLEEEVKG